MTSVRASRRLLAMALPGLIVLALFLMLPLGAVLIEAAKEHAIASFFASRDLLEALENSLVIGFSAATEATLIGIPIAIHMSRMPPARRAVLQLVIALPLTFSGLIIAFGFILLLGRAGFVTMLLARLGADPASVAGLLYGPAGLELAYVYYLSPRVVLLLLPVLANFDERQLLAAESLGASRLRALVDILAPQIAPTVLGAFCLVAAVAVSTYGTALALVGTQINILPLRLYGMVSDDGTDLPLAAATAIVLVVACSLIMTIAEIFNTQTKVTHVRH